MAAGKTLITDPGLSGPVTVLLPQPVSLDQGFRVLEAVLNTKGYTINQEPMLIRVVPALNALYPMPVWRGALIS